MRFAFETKGSHCTNLGRRPKVFRGIFRSSLQIRFDSRRVGRELERDSFPTHFFPALFPSAPARNCAAVPRVHN